MTRSGARSSARWLAPLALAGLTFVPAQADRLYLDSGRHIDVGRWWIEGDTLVYEADGGTVGIPRSIVVRVDTGPAARRGGPARPPAASPASRPGPPADGAALGARLARAERALEGRDFERAAADYLALLQDHPELYAARVGYSISAIELGHDALALSVVLDGIALEPDRAPLHVLLGELRYRDERLDDALRSWRRAFELEPGDALRDRILKVERELHASRDYDLAASSHFTLRYDGSVDLDLAASVLDYLEEQYWQITETFRHSPPQPITVQLFPEREFRSVTLAPDWAGGVYDGKIRVPLGGLTRLTPDARRVLVHELTHAVVHSKSRGGAPRWLHEGLAQMAEGRTLLRRDARALSSRLEATPESRWAAIEFSYPRALSQSRFLASRSGFDSLVELLERLGAGAAEEEALRQVYGQDWTEICLAWGRDLLGEDRP